MKMAQAWGWLVAGVLAAGLNASYHHGGLQWAHQAVEQIADQVEYRSQAVWALASGDSERFLAASRMLTARNEAASCPITAKLAQAQTGFQNNFASKFENKFEYKFADGMARSQAQLDVWSAHSEAQRDRLEAQRERMEARIQARVNAEVARIRIPAVAFSPVSVRVPACPRIRVEVPQVPMVRIPAPVIEVESGSGPI